MAEAGAAPQAEEPKGPYLVPATVQTESAASLALTACGGRTSRKRAPARAALGQNPPFGGHPNIKLAWAWLLVRLARACVPPAQSQPCLLRCWVGYCSLHMH